MSINFPSALSTDLKKCFLSVKFLLSVIVFLILIFSMGCVLLDTDTPDYSIAEFIFKTDKSLWLNIRLTAAQIFLHRDFQINGWEYLFRF